MDPEAWRLAEDSDCETDDHRQAGGDGIRHSRTRQCEAAEELDFSDSGTMLMHPDDKAVFRAATRAGDVALLEGLFPKTGQLVAERDCRKPHPVRDALHTVLIQLGCSLDVLHAPDDEVATALLTAADAAVLFAVEVVQRVLWRVEENGEPPRFPEAFPKLPSWGSHGFFALMNEAQRQAERILERKQSELVERRALRKRKPGRPHGLPGMLLKFADQLRLALGELGLDWPCDIDLAVARWAVSKGAPQKVETLRVEIKRRRKKDREARRQ